MSYKFRNFSHIYIEEQAEHYPLTQAILQKYKNSEIISIKNYKEVLNRNQQNFKLQKSSPKLILAKRESEYLYAGSNIAPNFGQQNFYYNTLALNCLYNCEYCYLQGMFNGAQLTVFVNNEDFKNAVVDELEKCKEIYLCLSYDTDLLALESLLGYCADWIEFSCSYQGLSIEVRTKCAAVGSLLKIKPHSGVILAWTLSPEIIASRYEHQAPSTKARLKAIGKLAEAGYNIRICIDPIIKIEDWQDHYDHLLEQLFSAVRPEQLKDISIGSFRIGQQYFKRLKKVRNDSPLIHQNLTLRDNVMALPEAEEQEILLYIKGKLNKWMPEDKIDIILSNSSV